MYFVMKLVLISISIAPRTAIKIDTTRVPQMKIYRCYKCDDCKELRYNTPKCETARGCATIEYGGQGPGSYMLSIKERTFRTCIESHFTETGQIITTVEGCYKALKEKSGVKNCFFCYSDRCNGEGDVLRSIDGATMVQIDLFSIVLAALIQIIIIR